MIVARCCHTALTLFQSQLNWRLAALRLSTNYKLHSSTDSAISRLGIAVKYYPYSDTSRRARSLLPVYPTQIINSPKRTKQLKTFLYRLQAQPDLVVAYTTITFSITVPYNFLYCHSLLPYLSLPVFPSYKLFLYF